MKLQASSLTALPGIRHAFFSREGGVSGGFYASLNGGVGSRDAPADVAENRARMARALDVEPGRLLTAYQIHSPDVVVVDDGWRNIWNDQARPRADALVTRLRGIAIGVSTADCGPVLFADREAGIVGAAHAGWRGALGGVLEVTLAAMVRLGARVERTRVALGPMISQRNYEVGAELIEKFEQHDPGNVRFFAPGRRPGHAQFDLPAFIAHRLQKAGVEAIEDLAVCTYGDPQKFFSFRRATHRGEPDYGRHISAISLI
ncbi:MAG: peptidoglycan editing factor PgeF [Pseudorhodoplanes sp.]